jgi:DNA invertase Pin-like site-specific DNA recombinase
MKPAAAIYLRVSKDDGSQTTDNQRPDVEQMATGRGYTVAPEHVYIDEASGAKGADERPALAALLAAAARGKFKAVFVWRLDRLSRDGSFYGGALMIADLDRWNVALLSYKETYLDTSGPLRNGLVQFTMDLAADERRKLIDRTNAGIARARAQGKHLGRPRAALSDAMLRRAAVRRLPNTPRDEGGEYTPWRKVRAQLIAEGFANVPSYATLARASQACTKGGVSSD